MNRRAHKKSRNGCVECKRRHIKCDETRPKCKNCTIIERDCVYRVAIHSAAARVGVEDGFQNCPSGPSTPSRSSRGSPSGDVVPDESRASSGPAVSPAPPSGPPLGCPNQPPAQSGPKVNMDHMELLVNFSLDLIIPELDVHLREPGTKLALKSGIEAPYLLHELLSLSARHLAHARPERRQFYLEQAAQLQTEAISLFNSTEPDIDDSNCVAIAMFSSILGRHLCVDTMATRDSGLDSFIALYLDFAQLRQRGTLVIRSVRAALEGSELSPFLTWGPSLVEARGEGHDCDGILDLIMSRSTFEDASLKQACARAVELVQAAYDSWGKRAVSGTKSIIQMIFSWAFLVPEAFNELLAQRQPEAVAVLGHYAVILHLVRDMWQIGDAGAHLLRIVGVYLGPEWSEWLAWPRSVVFADS